MPALKTVEYLIKSAKDGNCVEIGRALDQGCDINAEEGGALYWSVLRGHADAVNLLLSRGADPNARRTAALAVAARDGKIDIAVRLLDSGAALNSDYDCPLRCAAKSGHDNIVALLLARGADVHARDDDVIQTAVYNGCNETMALLLAQGGYPPKVLTKVRAVAMQIGLLEVVAMIESARTMAKLSKSSNAMPPATCAEAPPSSNLAGAVWRL